MNISRTKVFSYNPIYKSNAFNDITFCSRKKQKDCFVSSQKLSDKEITSIKKEMAKYPEDIQYRKKLLIDAGINPSEYYKLRPIIGVQEFESILKELETSEKSYVPGYRSSKEESILDSHNLENVKKRLFNANFHIHSEHSDGKMSIQEILDEANEYAIQLKKTKNKPFYIAITDHNCINGCKEALKIIKNNSKKYENLRVVLGAELSLKLDSLYEYELNKPQTIHLLTMGINPFDKELNEFLGDLTEHKKSPLNPKKITLDEAMKTLKKQKYCKLALAHPAWPHLPQILKNPENYIEATKKYIQLFKDSAKDQALYTEAFYQSYDGEISQDKKLLKTIKDFTKQLGLLCAGGIDTHGRRIFYCDSKSN